MSIISDFKIKAKKSLGQNFLENKEKLDKISNFLEIKNKNIVEIGPGYGALTEKLLEKNPKNLELVEVDFEMIDILNSRIKKGELDISKTNFSIKNLDVLKYEPDFKNYFVIANIPYYITSPILRHFFYDVRNSPEKMLILMQKDVGDKILHGTSPLIPLLKGEGNKEFFLSKNTKKTQKLKNSVLSLFLQKKAFIKEVLFVAKECFNPVPKVDSSVLYFEKHNLFSKIDDKKFLDFIKLAFSEPRKKLSKNLAKRYKKEDIFKIFEKYNVSENSRAEELNISLYCKFVGEFDKVFT